MRSNENLAKCGQTNTMNLQLATSIRELIGQTEDKDARIRSLESYLTEAQKLILKQQEEIEKLKRSFLLERVKVSVMLGLAFCLVIPVQWSVEHDATLPRKKVSTLSSAPLASTSIP